MGNEMDCSGGPFFSSLFSERGYLSFGDIWSSYIFFSLGSSFPITYYPLSISPFLLFTTEEKKRKGEKKGKYLISIFF
jgi:hypothetical protein